MFLRVLGSRSLGVYEHNLSLSRKNVMDQVKKTEEELKKQTNLSANIRTFFKGLLHTVLSNLGGFGVRDIWKKDNNCVLTRMRRRVGHINSFIHSLIDSVSHPLPPLA